MSAKDRLVIPGGIDPHIHCLMPVRAPGRPDVLTDPPSQVSKAALHGGTTTLIDFVQCVHERTVQESIEATQAQWKDACYCDYGFHLTLMGEVPQPHFGQLADAMQDGHASIKIFTTNIRPGNLGRMVPHGHIWEALKVVAAAGGIACIHAEDNDIVMFMYEKLMRENRVSFEHMAEVHNALSEELSFNRVIRLAENVEGAALYMVHVSAATGVAALEASRATRLPDVRRDAASVPDVQRRGLQAAGRADVPHLPVAQVSRGPEAPVGGDQPRRHPGHRHRRAVLPAPGQAAGQPDRRHDRRQLGRRAAGRADVHQHGDQARLLGGAFRRHDLDQRGAHHGPLSEEGRAGGRAPTPTSCCCRPASTKTITAADLHETDYTPWEGHVVTAWPTVTILRGNVVVENGAFHGDLKHGQFLKRKVADEIRSRPAV